MTCEHCAYAEQKGFCPVFNYYCDGCRLRALLAEPCKLLRKYMAEDMARRFDVPNWKVEPNCGCKNVCKRHTTESQGRYKIVEF